MIVEVDEAIEAEVWRLSIDMPSCYISVQIDGKKQLGELLEFLHQPDQPDSPAQVAEFELGHPESLWVWDDEKPRRLFVWLNRGATNAMRAVLDPQQVNCIRSALTDAGK
jgi:hypothetical protein